MNLLEIPDLDARLSVCDETDALPRMVCEYHNAWRHCFRRPPGTSSSRSPPSATTSSVRCATPSSVGFWSSPLPGVGACGMSRGRGAVGGNCLQLPIR